MHDESTSDDNMMKEHVQVKHSSIHIMMMFAVFVENDLIDVEKSYSEIVCLSKLIIIPTASSCSIMISIKTIYVFVFPCIYIYIYIYVYIYIYIFFY